jgi:hypothetical protein
MHLTHILNHLTVKLPCHLKILIYRHNNTSTGNAKMKRVRENPMGDEEVRDMKRQRVEKPMGDEELREVERRGGERVGDGEAKGR